MGLIIELNKKDIDKLEQSLLKLGKGNYIDKETMEDALEKYGEFNFIDGETGMKVDFWILQIL